MSNLIQFPQSAALIAELRELMQADLLRKAEQVQHGWEQAKKPRLVLAKAPRIRFRRSEIQRALNIGSCVEVTPELVAKKAARAELRISQRREA